MLLCDGRWFKGDDKVAEVMPGKGRLIKVANVQNSFYKKPMSSPITIMRRSSVPALNYLGGGKGLPQ